MTFNTAQAVNDAGQILVWSDAEEVFTPNATSYLLTPAIARRRQPRRPVDINDLTIVLANYGQTGHELEPRRVHRRRHGGHQRPDYRAGAYDDSTGSAAARNGGRARARHAGAARGRIGRSAGVGRPEAKVAVGTVRFQRAAERRCACQAGRSATAGRFSSACRQDSQISQGTSEHDQVACGDIGFDFGGCSGSCCRGICSGRRLGYYCTQLIGYSNDIYGTPPLLSYGESLLANGSVVGETFNQRDPTFPPGAYAATWNASGSITSRVSFGVGV